MDDTAIRREIDDKIAAATGSKTSRAFIDERGVPFIYDLVLFVDLEDPDCREAVRFLADRGRSVDVIDVTDYEGELLFDPLPIDAYDVPVLYTKRDGWYIGVGLIEAAINGGMI
jgi:hypothetical protein